MLVDQVKILTPESRFLYWIKERESIRLAKESGSPPPWTDDVILSTYRFCNVRRMDDRVSRWLLENWYEPNYNHANMPLACTLARFINRPATLQAIGFPVPWDPEGVKTKLRSISASGTSIFNGAYIIYGGRGSDKITGVIDDVCDNLVQSNIKLDPRSMRKTWSELCSLNGFGSFMAGQVVADLRHAMEGEWRDRGWWAPKGPGSVRGMNRLHSLPLNHSFTQEEFEVKLVKLIHLCNDRLPASITGRLEAMDVQNCLCEWDKMERTLWGEGKPKQLYRAGRSG